MTSQSEIKGWSSQGTMHHIQCGRIAIVVSIRFRRIIIGQVGKNRIALGSELNHVMLRDTLAGLEFKFPAFIVKSFEEIPAVRVLSALPRITRLRNQENARWVRFLKGSGVSDPTKFPQISTDRTLPAIG